MVDKYGVFNQGKPAEEILSTICETMEEMGIEIIKALEKDIEGILQLYKDCSHNMMDNLIDQWDDVYPNKEIFLDDIKRDSLYIAVSDNSEQIVACIVLNEHQDPEYKEVKWKHDSKKAAVIHRLMVHPKHEGKGIAQSLVIFIEKLAKENQYGAIRLDVFANNLRAVSFYKKLGYVVTGKVIFRKGQFFCCEKLI
ncbi:GNAT family N-acetyltransferase [Desulfosporosinus sp. OT]|uniref:GNAT family N-acetyltransferase n=1 Tax=Desulfosporosinus sp. OT TaxID=913865 RepID=UPI000223ACE0|nr:GNAT family N-acetyltransferase [Desulfosporosinus sp. OT]EGW36222.1 acetyltransferase family protein [Desulfosporosinus sp. OT]